MKWWISLCVVDFSYGYGRHRFATKGISKKRFVKRSDRRDFHPRTSEGGKTTRNGLLPFSGIGWTTVRERVDQLKTEVADMILVEILQAGTNPFAMVGVEGLRPFHRQAQPIGNLPAGNEAMNEKSPLLHDGEVAGICFIGEVGAVRPLPLQVFSWRGWRGVSERLWL